MSEHDAIERAWHDYHGPIQMEGEDDYFPALPPLFKRGFLDGVKHAKRERDEAREIAAKYEDRYFSTLKERDQWKDIAERSIGYVYDNDWDPEACDIIKDYEKLAGGPHPIHSK